MINVEKLDLWIKKDIKCMGWVNDAVHSVYAADSATGSLSWVSDSISGNLISSICCGNCPEIFVEVQDPQTWQQAESIHSCGMGVF